MSVAIFYRATLTLMAFGLAFALQACDPAPESDEALEHPESWQAHLKKSTIPVDKLVVNKSVYVPVYSHIYFENRRRTVELAETVSFRNTDSQNAVVLRSVNYYGSDGKRLRSYLAQPVEVGPFATADFVVTRTDISGGTGANFVINWGATSEVSPPIVEAIMISCGPSRNLSFVSRGLVLDRAMPDDNSRVDRNAATAPTGPAAPASDSNNSAPISAPASPAPGNSGSDKSSAVKTN